MQIILHIFLIIDWIKKLIYKFLLLIIKKLYNLGNLFWN